MAGLFFDVLNVGVSYINMSHVCFWHRSSSNQGHKQRVEVLVEVVYISGFGAKTRFGIKIAVFLDFSVKKSK